MTCVPLLKSIVCLLVLTAYSPAVSVDRRRFNAISFFFTPVALVVFLTPQCSANKAIGYGILSGQVPDLCFSYNDQWGRMPTDEVSLLGACRSWPDATDQSDVAAVGLACEKNLSSLITCHWQVCRRLQLMDIHFAPCPPA